MKLAEATWQEIDSLDKDTVVVVPTGSLEQHGPHLPLFTDSLLVTHVAEAAETECKKDCLLTPTIWLGASAHHMSFAGSLTNSFGGYDEALLQVLEGLHSHGFWRFFVLNGHGGNTEPNGIATRKFKEAHKACTVCHAGYFDFIGQDVLDAVLTGPIKGIRHSCEAEVSMMMACHPSLVRADKLRDDGFTTDPSAKGVVWFFDELTEEGSLGFATQASAEKGSKLLEAALHGVVGQIRDLRSGVSLRPL